MLAKRELARRHLKDFVLLNFPKFKLNWHHQELFDALEKVERGETKRLMVFMPPRHSKSEICSIQFPAWLMGRNKDRNIVEASYSGDLATDFGRQTRNLVRSRNYRNIFTDVELAQDSDSKSKWNTNGRGAYNAVGVGGSLTGKGADFLIIDDPVKDRKDADSEVIRKSTWDWWRSTARTRLSPNGAIVLIMCMTGDTPVLMADGTEKQLKDIRQGDEVATYLRGKLSQSTVTNWQSNGRDAILKITTSSGKVVRANKRHPFLVSDNNTLKWIRTENLNTTHKIVTARDSGENGKGKYVPIQTAINQSSVEGIALPTMRRRSGQTGIAHRLLTPVHDVMHVLNTATALVVRNMTGWLKNRMANVLSANNPLLAMLGRIGATNYALTTVTTQTRFGGFYATTATLLSDTPKQSKTPERLQITSDFTLDGVVSVEEDGIEEVFDLEVADTENFIANGLVSHNTRWHDDDLAGRILRESADDWEIINFPAVATKDEPHRKKGEALWADHFGLENLMQTKSEIGSYEWSSLYQQDPIDSELQEFKKSWFKTIEWDEVEKKETVSYLTLDTAVSEKESADYTGVVRNWVDNENNWYVKAYRMRVNPTQLIDLLFTLYQTDKYAKMGIEKTTFSQALEPFIKDEMRKRGVFLPIVELKHHQTQKETRIRGLIPRYQNGSIYHIKGECEELEEELLRFPRAVNDDVMDSMAYQLQVTEKPVSREPDIPNWSGTYETSEQTEKAPDVPIHRGY